LLLLFLLHLAVVNFFPDEHTSITLATDFCDAPERASSDPPELLVVFHIKFKPVKIPGFVSGRLSISSYLSRGQAPVSNPSTP
jgi:hypothetical protein